MKYTIDSVTDYAWPGGYGVVYQAEDGADLCGSCARHEIEANGTKIVGHALALETAESCDECGRVFEAAYPEDDAVSA